MISLIVQDLYKETGYGLGEVSRLGSRKVMKAWLPWSRRLSH